MANKIKGINIKIGADITGLDTALKGIESAGKKATSELNEVNRSLKNNNDSVVLWKQKQELLTTAVEESRKKLDFLREAQEQIKRQFENGEIDSGQYRAFQREIENTERQTRYFEGQLQQTNQRIEELGNGLEESGQQAENSANGGYTVLGNVFANVITRGIEIAGIALKNFTQDVVTTGMEYEAAISNVVAISGAMAEEVEMLQAKAEEMGATTKFTATESAEAMSYMAMAGWKVNDMMSGLDGIMDLSAASGESLASVSDIVTDALTAFGLTAGDSAHFADVLAAASSNANTNVAMMGETFKYSAPIAGALGFSIYTRRKSTQNQKSNIKSVFLTDNPFGEASSEHLVKSLIEIIKKFNMQLICFSDLKQSSITNNFDLIYQLSMRKAIYSSKSHLHIDEIINHVDVSMEFVSLRSQSGIIPDENETDIM